MILHADLAGIYGVSVKRLNEQVKRNKEQFPDDFCFRLRREYKKYLPNAFTEHGTIMAANVLNSRRAACSMLPTFFWNISAIQPSSVSPACDASH